MSPRDTTLSEAERAEQHQARTAGANAKARNTYAEVVGLCGAEIAPDDLRPETIAGVEIGVPALALALKALAVRIAAIERRDAE